ncbi:MAG TPA: hypothetical protein VEA36_01490 [Candidatus Paceibacterota bacterium]|nr:hypothetical protein [Candidatus Paceibacterota bacterium]
MRSVITIAAALLMGAPAAATPVSKIPADELKAFSRHLVVRTRDGAEFTAAQHEAIRARLDALQRSCQTHRSEESYFYCVAGGMSAAEVAGEFGKNVIVYSVSTEPAR